MIRCIHFNLKKVASMIKKLVRHGNSRALVIDKPILELLNITDDTEIEIVTDGTSLTMRPVTVDDAGRRHAFELALEETNRTWGGALKKLSE